MYCSSKTRICKEFFFDFSNYFTEVLHGSNRQN
nr:MAG TPA: hypothetical protein [Caudoviricetes sp.]